MDLSVLNALTGLQAAQRRFEVSASNVVNSRSQGYLPQRVQTVATATGGTRPVAVPVKPATVPVFDVDGGGEDGVKERPNVSLESEIVEQTLARRAFEANLRLIETTDEMSDALLDTTA